MSFTIQKATKSKSFLRMAIDGPSGAGKTFTMLTVGKEIAESTGGKFAVIDTEHGSASKYAGDVADFDTLQLDTFSPETYVKAIEAIAEAGYTVLGIDSLSHAWSGKDGALEQVDKIAKRSNSSNTFAAWRDVTPMQQRLVEAILAFPGHVIVTMRTKTEYVLEENDKGKKVPRKIGMAPVQRDGIEYEFDVVGDMTLDNDLLVSKSRCSKVAETGIYKKPGKKFAQELLAWLNDGVERTEPATVVHSTNGAQSPRDWLNSILKTVADKDKWVEVSKPLGGSIEAAKLAMAADIKNADDLFTWAKLEAPLEVETVEVEG